MTHGNKKWVQMKHKYHSTHIKQNKCVRQNICKPHNEKYEKVLNLGGFWPPTPGKSPNPDMENMFTNMNICILYLLEL
jgi:hypothetical protein